jgi:hypothetical protein
LGKGEEVANSPIILEGQCKSLGELVDAGVEDATKGDVQIGDVSSRLENLETEKRVAQQPVLELRATDADRKPLVSEVETLK